MALECTIGKRQAGRCDAPSNVLVAQGEPTQSVFNWLIGRNVLLFDLKVNI